MGSMQVSSKSSIAIIIVFTVIKCQCYSKFKNSQHGEFQTHDIVPNAYNKDEYKFKNERHNYSAALHKNSVPKVKPLKKQGETLYIKSNEKIPKKLLFKREIDEPETLFEDYNDEDYRKQNKNDRQRDGEQYGHKDKIKVKHHHHHHHYKHIKEVVKKVPEMVPVEKIVHVPVEKVVEKFIHVPKIVEKIVNIPIEKIVQVSKPYPVEKIVHIPIQKVIEKIIHIPKPYPIEKIIEKIIHVPVEKIVEKIVHVPQPYPVEKILQKVISVPKPFTVIKPVPFPVGIKVPVEVEHPRPQYEVKEIPRYEDTSAVTLHTERKLENNFNASRPLEFRPHKFELPETNKQINTNANLYYDEFDSNLIQNPSHDGNNRDYPNSFDFRHNAYLNLSELLNKSLIYKDNSSFNLHQNKLSPIYQTIPRGDVYLKTLHHGFAYPSTISDMPPQPFQKIVDFE